MALICTSKSWTLWTERRFLIKPWFSEFGPRGEVRQPAWSVEMLGRYYATSPTE
jgi:hypothetical protein